MYTEILADDVTLRLVFHQACIDLGLPAEATTRRENLALIMLTMVQDGEKDIAAIRRRSVEIMRHSRL